MVVCMKNKLNMKLNLLFLSLFIPQLWMDWVIGIANAETENIEIANSLDTNSVVVDEVVASIQGEPVLDSELRARQGLSSAQGPEVGSKKKILLEMLLAKEAQRLGVVVDQQTIESYLAEVQRQNGVDAEGFQNLLQSQGYNLDSYREVVKKEIERTRVYALEVRPSVDISEAEIDKYLQENQSVLPDAGSVAVVRYDLDCGTDITCSAPELVEEGSRLRSALLSGAVNQLDVQFKRKELGFLKSADLKESMAQRISGLEDGQVSEAALLDGKLSLFQIVGRIDSEGKMTGLMRDQVRNNLVNKKLPKAVETWLSDDLPKKYNLVLTKDL